MAMAIEEEEEQISEGIGNGMLIFSEDPKSFKIDRKSVLASRLSSSISRELLQFLGNYTDEILSEYITVLVCNGKHQYQARDDLEAFLGERSGEFVSWLWDFLMKFIPQSTINESTLILQRSIVASPDGSDTDVRANRLKDSQNCGNVDANEALAVDAMFPCLPVNSNPLPPPSKEFSEGSQRFLGLIAPINEVNAENVPPKTHGNEIRRKGFPVDGEESSQHVDKYRKVVSSQCNNLPNQHSHFPTREPAPKNLESYISEETRSKRTLVTNDDSGRSVSPIETAGISHQIDKSRRSVWDRLGKPCENTPATESTDGHIVHTINQVPGDHSLSGYVHNEVRSKRCDSNNLSGVHRKAEHGVGAEGKIQVANIRQKRHFGEFSTGTGATELIHPMGEGCMDSQSKRDSQSLKKSNLGREAPRAAKPTLVTARSPSAIKLDSVKNEQRTVPYLRPTQTAMLDVKQKLHQVEMEMAKLGSKHAEMKKDGKPNLLSTTCGLKQSEEDFNSRTVFVTNVHFAATKDTLSKYFGKCGLILNVAILIDKATLKPKGAAYVTFASKEAADKAVAMSGASFLSRSMKVVRKSEVAAAPSVEAQFSGNPLQAQLSCINRTVALDRPHQWRRDSLPASEPSPSTRAVQARVSAKSASSGGNQ